MAGQDQAGIPELIGATLSSGDLAPSSGPCGLDKVMALGLLGMRDKMADVVFRLKYANGADAYHDAHRAVAELARRLDRAENWRMQPRLDDMAKRVLDYWLDDICEFCKSRSADPSKMGGTAMKVTGAPDLEVEYCPYCRGSGKRPFPWLTENRNDRAAQAHTVLLVAIEETERRLTAGLISRLFAKTKGEQS